MDRVYKFGCRSPNDERTAVQLLGQAWLYYEDVLRAYARHAHRRVKGDDDAHMFAYATHAKNRDIRAARARRGHLLDCGTYWLVEAAALQAAKTSLGPPKVRPFDGTGRIGAAIQPVDQFSADAWNHGRVSLSAPDSRGHAELSILVGEKKRARALTWPVKLHRPFPRGAIVKQVAVQRTRNGHRFRWEALVTISFDERAELRGSTNERSVERDVNARGAVGVDVGWYRDGEQGFRCATHAGPDGEVGALHIDLPNAFLYSDSVRSIRDVNFDDAKAYAQNAGLEGASHAKLWRNKQRLVDVAGRVEDLGLALWVERDKHLEDIECGVRQRAMRRRLDSYRRYADALARRFKIVALEDMPMQDWVGKGETHAKERRRSMAALYLLQQCIVHRFGDARVDWVPAEYTTMTCAECGAVQGAQVGAERMHECDACGARWHQDENAARVIRSRCERWTGGGSPVRARSRKLKKKGKKKAASRAPEVTESATAREAVDKAAE